MSGEEIALFDTIRNNPDDDTTRLVYADWLDDHGDPRAAWLRAEVESRRVPVPSQRFWELKQERKRLQPANPEWVAAMQYRPCHRPMFTKLPVERGERWRLADEFIELWHTPLTRADGCSEAELEAAEGRLGLRLPAALREWYVLGGTRLDVWSGQDDLCRPAQLHLELDGRLTFRRECQNCEAWFIRPQDLGLDDPPVYQREDMQLACTSVSAFALLVLVHDAWLWRPSVHAHIYPSQRGWHQLASRLLPTELRSRYRSIELTIWEGDDLLVEQDASAPENPSRLVTARTQVAFEPVRAIVGDQMERFS